MLRVLLPLLLLAGCSTTQQATSTVDTSADPNHNVITLNGNSTQVKWDDGDSFTFLSGQYKGDGVRLEGWNTLESYGPVHRWGQWTAKELYGVAKESLYQARRRSWECTTRGKRDYYNRVLVTCPELGVDLVGRGLAHVYAFKTTADPELMALQKQARIDGLGMWEKGRPEYLVTSLHSAEGKGGRNSVVHTRTGQWDGRAHQDEYELCEEICVEDAVRGSCMVYVPYPNRYKDQPDCLR
jgi:micrococcal nuclease